MRSQATLCFRTAILGMALCVAGQLQANGAQADNTRNNKTTTAASEKNADKATNAKSDLQMMKEIRKAVVDDKSLSTYGHNVKIVASHGKVTLKGPVHSEDEKKAIEDHARKIAGDENVVDQITVKGDAKKSGE